MPRREWAGAAILLRGRAIVRILFVDGDLLEALESARDAVEDLLALVRRERERRS